MPVSRKVVEHLVLKITQEEIDKALSMSDKRRKKFLDTVKDTDAPRLNLKDKHLTEADATTPPPAEPPPAVPPGGGPPAPVPPPAPGGATVPPVPGAPPVPGEEPGVPDAAGGVDPTAGGGDAGGFGGFGGGGGGGPDTGGTPPEGSSDDEPDLGDEGETETPEDPIEGMVSGAKDLAEKSQDPTLILKDLKGKIQSGFEEPENALGLVKALYDTNDTLLQSVAQRLYLWIKTTSGNN